MTDKIAFDVCTSDVCFPDTVYLDSEKQFKREKKHRRREGPY